MEGLTWGSRLGTEKDTAQELKEKLDTFMKLKEHVQPSGNTTVSLSNLLSRGIGIQTFFHSQISERSMLYFGGDAAVDGHSGAGGAATLIYKHFLSPVSCIDLFASAGLRSLLVGVETTHYLSRHVVGTIGVAVGSHSAITIGWDKEKEKSSASGHLKVGTTFVEASGKYTHLFSNSSRGHLQGTIGSHDLEIEVGGDRKLSGISDVGMAYSIGIKGIFWKLRLHYRGQKFVVPVLLSTHLNAGIAMFATGAFFIPTWLYSLAKKFILKHYNLRRENQKALEVSEGTSAKVKEAQKAAGKAKKLLGRVAFRKQKKQLEIDGLVISKALYGSVTAVQKRDELVEPYDELLSQFIDVTLPLNYLVSDNGQLKLHEGVKKSGIMGFYDPCPGEPKQLYVEYIYGSDYIHHQVVVGDYDELIIPQERHRIEYA